MLNEVKTVTEISVYEPCDLGRRVKEAFHAAVAENSKLDPAVLSMEGMSGKKYRMFINNLVRSLGDTKYLEIGTWMGSTLCSAINRNSIRATAIDNWSEFGGPKQAFLENLRRFQTPQSYVNFLEQDFRSIDYSSLGKFRIYLFDGPHSARDHHDGITLAWPALETQFILIVDDWNLTQVRSGTMQALAELGAEIKYAIEIRTTLDGTHPPIYGRDSDWHDGYFISVLAKADGNEVSS